MKKRRPARSPHRDALDRKSYLDAVTLCAALAEFVIVHPDNGYAADAYRRSCDLVAELHADMGATS